ncbi:hypothetical protein [Alkalilimnicola sp. S0819]|uniref:hypothetical protein n=1 Tax=Alkalilimnicola sp. S0819 TaxID=2613922 RepID=UPI0012617EAD|nr:hypothetical protein [Alkalilimnicola sp. S0819]KAB7622709.1 hypothetical protein F3N43_11960 [Alkalilimnicola sp. S0819]MPQ17349.1 hypothetical protein [Alkalilimnicola sp. S0819]
MPTPIDDTLTIRAGTREAYQSFWLRLLLRYVSIVLVFALAVVAWRHVSGLLPSLSVIVVSSIAFWLLTDTAVLTEFLPGERMLLARLEGSDLHLALEEPLSVNLRDSRVRMTAAHWPAYRARLKIEGPEGARVIRTVLDHPPLIRFVNNAASRSA